MLFFDAIKLHPIFVHFPIALFVSAFLFELLSFLFKKEQWGKTAFYTYVLAVFVSPLAVQTGLWEAGRMHLKHPIVDLHRAFAFLTMGSSLLSLLILWLSSKVGSKEFKIAFRIFTVLMMLFVCVTAFFGGKMVFEYGIGVEM